MKRLPEFLTGLIALVSVLIFSMATVSAADGVDWEAASIQVTGMGVAPANAKNAGHARIMARRAAIVDAQRNAVEYINGVQVDADTTVEMAVVQNDTIRTHISGIVRNAKIVSEKYSNDGAYEVVLEVPLFGASSSVASAVLTKNKTATAFPEADTSVAPSNITVNNIGNITYNTTYGGNTSSQVNSGTTNKTTSNNTAAVVSNSGNKTTVTTNKKNGTSATTTKTSANNDRVSHSSAAPAGKAIGNFTGVIIDCRGLGTLNPVMSPVIKNEKSTPIYGYKNLDSAKVIANGMASYVTSIEKATRAGSNPLVLKAIRLEDHNANPVLSTADANRLLIENGATHFLDDTNVVFLR